MPRIAFAGSKNTTLDCMTQFLSDGFYINLLITLTPEQAIKHEVAGYMDLRPFAQKNNIPVYHPMEYSLKHNSDQEALLSKLIDCLLVVGWQRLIPEWWLTNLTCGAFGMHGSPEPLPRGRGRSPMNWSLLQGKTSFLTHLFKYDPGIDSGGIIGFQKFDITLWDDCNTLHMKNRIAMNRLLKQYLPAILSNTVNVIPQPKDIEPTYYNKRTSEDGFIDWNKMDMMLLHNHIRAQTRPFPGAFSFLEGSNHKFYFWHAHPFDSHLIFYDKKPGSIVDVFSDNSFLVSVWDGSLRVYDYTIPEGEELRIGKRFIK
jgi:methionyl-tRNA formyltransferase